MPASDVPSTSTMPDGEEPSKQARHRSLLDQLSVGVYRSTPRGRLLEANQAMADLLGYDDPEALRACQIGDLYVDEEDRKRHLYQLHRGLQQTAEFALRCRDGTSVWVRNHPRAVTDASGEVMYYDGVLVDITERKQAKEQLAASESRLRAILEHVADLIEIVEADGTIRYASGAVQEVTGFAPGEVQGHSVFERIHPEDLARAKHKFEVLREQPGATTEHEYRFQHRSGEWRYLSVRMRNFLGRPGIDGLLGTVQDVTSKKQFEEELIEAKEEAEELARLKSSFLTNMSHEIRTPLASILGFAEVLVEEAGGEMREFAELIQQGGERLSETLDSVLDLARLEAGGFEPDFEAVSARVVLQEAANLYAPLAEDKGLRFELDLPGEALSLWADRAGVGRMLANLLSNAIKFTSEGTVRLEARDAAPSVELRVSDTGKGMSETFRAHLFEAFRQESSGLARLHEGAGLGLAITRRLAEVMKADIEVESEEGNGSTFLLRFPKPEGRRTAAVYMPDEPLPHFDEELGRVLVVEDNRDTRRLLKHVLNGAWAPTVVGGPQDALEVARGALFDLVLVDINLGASLDGVDVMHRLRQDARYERVPFVALTAYAMPGDEESFRNLGFDAYLAKPFTNEELLRLLKKMSGGER